MILARTIPASDLSRDTHFSGEPGIPMIFVIRMQGLGKSTFISFLENRTVGNNPDFDNSHGVHPTRSSVSVRCVC